MRKVILLIITGCILILLFAFKRSVADFIRDPRLNPDQVIMHAMGSINGRIYTNSLEAFQYHYKRGRRIFEVDLSLTADSLMVASHTCHDSQTVEAIQKKTPWSVLDLPTLLKLLKDHPDMVLVTDTKCDFNRFIHQLTAAVQAYDPALLSRIIPQIYQEQDWYTTMHAWKFDKLIYTLYKTNASDEEVIQFVKTHPNIRYVTVHFGRFTENLAHELGESDVKVFVHTINEIYPIRKFVSRGAYGVYTDVY